VESAVRASINHAVLAIAAASLVVATSIVWMWASGRCSEAPRSRAPQNAPSITTPVPPEPAGPDASRTPACTESDGIPKPGSRSEFPSLPAPSAPEAPKHLLKLHVVDESSGADLDEVTIGYSDNLLRPVHRHPVELAADEVLIAHARSPVEFSSPLLVPDRRYLFWVGARDHAWSNFEITSNSPTELKVPLARAAALVVDVSGELPSLSQEEIAEQERPLVAPTLLEPGSDLAPTDSPIVASPGDASEGHGALLRVASFPPDLLRGPPIVYEAPARIGTTRIEGLPPGSFEVRVEVDVVPPRVAGRGRIELKAGETAHLTLQLQSIPPPSKVALAGTLVLPESWGRDAIALQITPMNGDFECFESSFTIPSEEMHLVPGRPHVHAWRSQSVTPGRFLIDVASTGASRIVDVGPEGREDVEIVIPEAGTVIVTFFDDASGRGTAVEKPTWYCALDAATRKAGGSSRPIELMVRSDATSYEGRVPVGPAQFVFISRTLSPVDRGSKYEIGPGENRVTVDVRRSQGVTVRLRVNGEPALSSDGSTIDERWLSKVAVEAASGRGKSDFSLIDRDATVTLLVSGPGRYRVAVPRVAGYAAVEPFEVDIPLGEVVVKDVDLVHE
jgi:hypothetical protein